MTAVDQLRIDRFTVGWLVEDHRRFVEWPALLDDLLARALESELDQVLAGRDSDELVAIDVIVVPEIVAEPGWSPTTVAAQWARELSRSISRVLDAAQGHRWEAMVEATPATRMVRYPDRTAALLACLRGWSAGRSGDAWAWPLLGLSGDGYATPHPGALLPELIDLAERVPVMFTSLAADGRLGSVLEALGDRAVIDLATRTWAAFGVQLDPILPVAAPIRGSLRGPIALLVRSLAQTQAAWVPSVSLVTAVAALAVAAERPGALAAGSGPALLAGLLSDLWREPLPLTAGEPDRDVVPRPDRLVDGSTQPAPDEITALGARPRDAGPRVAGEPFSIAAPTARSSLDQDAVGIEPDTADRTDYAGLLFLLHLLDPRTGSSALGPNPADLYLLGHGVLALAGVELIDPADPALLAFSGLAAPNLRDLDLDLLDAPEMAIAVRTVTLLLRDRFDDLQAPDERSELVRRVVERAGLIRRDPGWTDVQLDLESVDVSVRAAGLDLDLGWLPVLGSVVRFRYV